MSDNPKADSSSQENVPTTQQSNNSIQPPPPSPPPPPDTLPEEVKPILFSQAYIRSVSLEELESLAKKSEGE